MSLHEFWFDKSSKLGALKLKPIPSAVRHLYFGFGFVYEQSFAPLFPIKAPRTLTVGGKTYICEGAQGELLSGQLGNVQGLDIHPSQNWIYNYFMRKPFK